MAIVTTILGGMLAGVLLFALVGCSDSIHEHACIDGALYWRLKDSGEPWQMEDGSPNTIGAPTPIKCKTNANGG